MLGGLGLNLGLWIIYAIILAKFMKRFFRERSSDADTLAKRVRAISAVLIINIVTFMV
jgi:membrane protein implicated in regulation of membrane protease activity